MKTRLVGIILLIFVPIVVAESHFIWIREYTVESKELTVEEQIMSVLAKAGVSDELQEVIVAQAKHESGNFTNRLHMEFNNPFAMKHPGKRTTTSLGKYGIAERCQCFASYSTIESATQDYLHYLQMINAPTDVSLSEYIDFLKSKGYFTDDLKRYKNGVRYWLKSSKQSKL